MFCGNDGIRTRFPRKFLKWVNKLGNWLLLLVLGLILFVKVINPWYIRMRLQRFADSMSELEIQQSLERSRARLAADKDFWFPVVHIKYDPPYQQGIVHFDDGGYVRFAFISGHHGRGVASTACFIGDHYKRFTTWSGWCCELMLDHVKDLADLDRQLAELEKSE